MYFFWGGVEITWLSCVLEQQRQPVVRPVGCQEGHAATAVWETSRPPSCERLSASQSRTEREGGRGTGLGNAALREGMPGCGTVSASVGLAVTDGVCVPGAVL